MFFCQMFSVNCHWDLFSENTLKCQCCLQTSVKTSVILIKELPEIVFPYILLTIKEYIGKDRGLLLG